MSHEVLRLWFDDDLLCGASGEDYHELSFSRTVVLREESIPICGGRGGSRLLLTFDIAGDVNFNERCVSCEEISRCRPNTEWLDRPTREHVRLAGDAEAVGDAGAGAVDGGVEVERGERSRAAPGLNYGVSIEDVRERRRRGKCGVGEMEGVDTGPRGLERHPRVQRSEERRVGKEG